MPDYNYKFYDNPFKYDRLISHEDYQNNLIKALTTSGI